MVEVGLHAQQVTCACEYSYNERQIITKGGRHDMLVRTSNLWGEKTAKIREKKLLLGIRFELSRIISKTITHVRITIGKLIRQTNELKYIERKK